MIEEQKYASLEEIKKWESEVHESSESADKLESQKVERIIGYYIAERPSEKNVVIMSLKFKEIKEERPVLIDEQIATGKSRGTIRDEKYRVLGYYQGDVKTIKEKIKEFFKDSKTPNKIRINKATLNNKKIIEEIDEFRKSLNNEIDFPPAKIKFVTCSLEGEANNKRKYTDARSEAHHGLEESKDKGQIEFDGEESQNLLNEIIHQVGTTRYPKQPDGRIKVEIAEDLSYEFLNALIFIVKPGGMAYGFVRAG